VTETDIFQQLTPLIAEVTGVSPDEIQMHSGLMSDLGAESLDLLDLSFLIEERFGIRLESDEFERQARHRLHGQPYEVDGFLTPPALEQLRAALPELNPERLAGPLRKTELPSILNVAVFVHLIQRKLATKEAVNA